MNFPSTWRMLAALAAVATAPGWAAAQSLTVQPVNVNLASGQKATTLVVTNHGERETSVQIRVYTWRQGLDEDELQSSEGIQVSPPMATIQPGSSQIVRLILRQSPVTSESSYRIILDEIPPPLVPGIVRIVLRLSIPIFAQPAARADARVDFHLERDDSRLMLVGANGGGRHEKLRDLVVTQNGTRFQLEQGASPYILAGAQRHWRLVPAGAASDTNADAPFELKSSSDAGAINRQVHLATHP